MTQLLYTGGRITSKSDAARKTLLAAEMEKLATFRQVTIETILRCWDVKLAQALLRVTREAETR